MQIQLDDIAGGKRLLWQIREEEFIDDTRTRDANWTLLVANWMGRYHHAARRALRSHRYLRTIVEAAHHLTFWALLELIWWEVQTCLDKRMIKGGVLLAAGHKGETSQIREHGSGPIVAVEPQQGASLWELVCSEIATNGHQGLAQFRSIASVAPVAKRAEPTFNCGPD
jgi:hypothetical protein